jgi:hypothetical protein
LDFFDDCLKLAGWISRSYQNQLFKLPYHFLSPKSNWHPVEKDGRWIQKNASYIGQYLERPPSWGT